MKMNLTAVLPLSCLLSFIGVSAQRFNSCQQYLNEENRLVRSMNFSIAEIYLNYYKACLWKGTDNIAQEKAQNLDFFSVISASEDGKGGWGRKNMGKEYLIDESFKSIRILTGRHLPFKNNFSVFSVENFKHGVINSKGDVIIKPLYDQIYDIAEDMFTVTQNGKMGFLDRHGQNAVPIVYEGVESFNEGLAAAKKNGKFGFIDKANIVKIPFQYEIANSFSEGLAVVKSLGKFGFIDSKGIIKIPFEYEQALSFKGGIASVMKSGKWALISINGNLLTEFKFDAIPLSTYNYGLIIFYENGKAGCINKKGEIIVAADYDDIKIINKSCLLLYRSNNATLYNCETKTFNLKKYEFVSSYFFNGMARAQLNGKYGYIDTTFKEIVPLEYEFASEIFLDGLAKVSKNGKVGYINNKNEVVIPFKYDAEISNSDGILLLRSNTEFYLYATDGKLITELPKNYRINGRYFNGLVLFTVGSKYGYINRKGEIVIEAKYEYLPEFHTGKIPARLNGMWGGIDLKGREVVPFTFENQDSVKVRM